jgi:CheY-like chemotaxis protein
MSEVLQGPGAGPMVLVVDDDPLQREEITHCLTNLGIRTHEEGNGHAALKAVASMHPAVVIMDIKMPGMDGIDAVKALQDANGYIPKIILITGYPESLYRTNRIGLPIHSVIEKPVPLRHLSQFVLSALEQEEEETTINFSESGAVQGETS